MATPSGSIPSFPAEGGSRRPPGGSAPWRPWTGRGGEAETRKPYSRAGNVSDAKHPKSLQFTHPVKLFWPKSKCFDYLYQDAETLLRSYPVQATICLYEESSEEEEDEDDDYCVDDDEEEEMEKELR